MKGYSGKEGHELAGDLFRREKEVKDDHKV